MASPSGALSEAGPRQVATGISDCMSLGVLTFDADLRTGYCSETVRRVLGIDEVTDLKLADASQDAELREALSSTVSGNGVYQLPRATYTSPSGAEHILKIGLSSLRNEGGDTVGGLMAIDVLDGLLRAEDELVTAERLAVLGRLAASVAHELNSPLDGSLRFVRLCLNRTVGGSDMERFLRQAETGLQRMADIVARLLDFSRTARLTQGEVDVNALVTEAVRSLDHKRADGTLVVSTDLADSLPKMRCGSVLEVLINLLSNAFDVLPPGGTVKVTTRLEGDQVVLEVADDGPGMPDEVVERVFDPFFTTKEVGKGTGLGLAIVRDIVEKYDGTIGVRSELDRGSTFTVRLPAPKA